MVWETFEQMKLVIDIMKATIIFFDSNLNETEYYCIIIYIQQKINER